jgi:hypothetical protein
MNKVGNVANDDFDVLSSEKAERNFSKDDLVNRKSSFGLKHTRESRRLCREYVPAWYLASGPDPRKDQNPPLPSVFRILGSRLGAAQHTALLCLKLSFISARLGSPSIGRKSSDEKQLSLGRRTTV